MPEVEKCKNGFDTLEAEGQRSLETWSTGRTWQLHHRSGDQVMPRIKIEVYGGCVTEVTGLRAEYEIVDHDHLEEQATSHKPRLQGTRVGPPKKDQTPSGKHRLDRSPDLG